MKIIYAVISSWVTAILLLLVVMSFEYFFDGANTSGIGLAIAVFLVYAFCILLGVIVIGLPVHYLSILAKNNSPFQYGLTGFFVPTVLVLLAKPFGNDPSAGLIVQAVFSGFLGCACALVFWYVAVKLERSNQENEHGLF